MVEPELFLFLNQEQKKDPQVVCLCLSDRCPRLRVCVGVCECVCLVGRQILLILSVPEDRQCDWVIGH